MFEIFGVGITAGLIAGVLQLLGYVLYWRLVIAVDGRLPNPLTWLMFGYGTVLLTVLEFDIGATWDELYLPIVCAACGFGVAANIWRKSYMTTGKRWPKEWTLKHSDLWDGMSLSIDIVLTVSYLLAWAVYYFGSLSSDGLKVAHLVFLFSSNVGTVFNFVPILRDTGKCPGHEHWLPWSVWTLSYTLLAVETWNRDDVVFPEQLWLEAWDISFVDWIWLLFYPVSNLLFHAWVALLALPARQRRHENARHQPGE